MNVQTMIPANDWLETGAMTAMNCGGGTATGQTMTNGGSLGNLNCYPSNTYLSPTVYYWHYPTRPIRLTLSEIERLRKAAKADKNIKAILAKFTDQIEITVDFE